MPHLHGVFTAALDHRFEKQRKTALRDEAGHWSRLPDRYRTAILWTVMLSALGATLMAINFHLANGGNHPWLIPADGFDETIDVDTVLTFIQLAFFTCSGYLLLKLRRRHQGAARRTDRHAALPQPS